MVRHLWEPCFEAKRIRNVVEMARFEFQPAHRDCEQAQDVAQQARKISCLPLVDVAYRVSGVLVDTSVRARLRMLRACHMKFSYPVNNTYYEI